MNRKRTAAAIVTALAMVAAAAWAQGATTTETVVAESWPTAAVALGVAFLTWLRTRAAGRAAVREAELALQNTKAAAALDKRRLVSLTEAHEQAIEVLKESIADQRADKERAIREEAEAREELRELNATLRRYTRQSAEAVMQGALNLDQSGAFTLSSDDAAALLREPEDTGKIPRPVPES